MEEETFRKCACAFCGGRIEYPETAIGEEIECPHCTQVIALPGLEPFEHVCASEETHKPAANPPPLPPPVIQTHGTRGAGSLLCPCKACGQNIAVSSETCIRCGQRWPTLNFCCARCRSPHFDICTIHSTSSVWVPPTILGVVSAGLFEAMRPKPRRYFRCLACGYECRC